ncbi:hypothetical protein U1Q18_034616 [Sarracenia purpurea var. burkii]
MKVVFISNYILWKLVEFTSYVSSPEAGYCMTLQMVQQTIDSNFNKYGLPNTKTGLPNHNKQLPLPVTTKNTVLRNLQNENRITVPKSMGSSLFPKGNGSELDDVKLSGVERPAPECLFSSSHQSLVSNAANGQLVYVRRRSEVELAKSSIFDNSSNNVFYPQARNLGQQDESIEQNSQVKESNICIPEVARIPMHSSVCFSSGNPSVPFSLGKFSNILQPTDSNYLAVSSVIPPLDYPKRMNNQQWEERYCQLQDSLKALDQTNQEDYVQMLRSLSSVELSRHAVELEKRSIQLSLEEAKEMQRVQLFDILRKYSKNSRAPSAQQGQSEK